MMPEAWKIGAIAADAPVPETASPAWIDVVERGDGPFDPSLSAVDADGRRALAVGLAITVVALAVPLTRFVATYMIILVHELGHAACGWLFGHPSVPAFDFAYGGGVTAIEERRTALVVVLYAAWGFSFWALRHRPRALVALGILIESPQRDRAAFAAPAVIRIVHAR